MHHIHMGMELKSNMLNTHHEPRAKHQIIENLKLWVVVPF
jgi:hypothetical protein